MNKKVYACPVCGRTVEVCYPSTFEPNRICGPHTVDGEQSYWYMTETVRPNAIQSDFKRRMENGYKKK